MESDTKFYVAIVKTVAIVQSNYIPWRGYFDLIRRSDVFVLYDDVQYTRRDWRNRNRIKTVSGLQWLTIPVEVKGKYTQKIRDVKIADPEWRNDHWNTMHHAYARAENFKNYSDQIEFLYRSATSEWLSEVNLHLIRGLCGVLGVHTDIRLSSEFLLNEGRSERLLGICRDLKATTYLSGPSAQEYLDVSLFRSAGIEINWMDYSRYPTYPQLHGPFEPAVSVLDLIFNIGPAASNYF